MGSSGRAASGRAPALHVAAVQLVPVQRAFAARRRAHFTAVRIAPAQRESPAPRRLRSAGALPGGGQRPLSRGRAWKTSRAARPTVVLSTFSIPGMDNGDSGAAD